jgi:hypothetical protein
MPSIATTRTGSPALMSRARLVRARQREAPTCTTPSGSTSTSAEPSSPIIHSRPIVGVAKRVRTIDGMPLKNVIAAPTMPTTSVSHDGRSTCPSAEPNMNHDDTIRLTMPTPVQKRGIPTWTSIAKANIANSSRATAHPRTGSAPRP